MKTVFLYLCLLLTCYSNALCQAPSKADPVIEGSKVIVELVKVFSSKKDQDKDPGCKGNHADICINNVSVASMTMYFEHRSSGEIREVVILPGGQECCLQAKIGVWTYDLRVTGSHQSVRKGDILIEGCNNVIMSLK